MSVPHPGTAAHFVLPPPDTEDLPGPVSVPQDAAGLSAVANAVTCAVQELLGSAQGPPQCDPGLLARVRGGPQEYGRAVNARVRELARQLVAMCAQLETAQAVAQAFGDAGARQYRKAVARAERLEYAVVQAENAYFTLAPTVKEVRITLLGKAYDARRKGQ